MRRPSRKLEAEIPSSLKIKQLEDLQIYFETVVSLLPAHIYWKDRNGVFLACNDLQAISAGFSDSSEMIGKTDYDMPWKDDADEIRKNDAEVRNNRCKVIKEEESLLANGEKSIFLSQKVPLINRENKVIGLLGISMDITERKRAEQLKIENEAQKVQIVAHENTKKMAEQMAHDIRSPIAGMKSALNSNAISQLPESLRIILRQGTERIEDIANSINLRYGLEQTKEVNNEKSKSLLVSLALLELLAEKKYEHKHLSVAFKNNFDANFMCIKVEPAHFKRMVSNLINNAVEAVDPYKGKIDLELKESESQIIVSVKDNGTGMPVEMVEKILQNRQIKTTKEKGHGIGLIQIRETLARNHGKLTIESKPGRGTTVSLAFPKTTPPSWVTNRLKLSKGDTVVILDDDTLIHESWDLRFNNYPHLNLEHFTDGKEAISYIKNFSAKDKLLLLSDYELLNQDINGLDVIKETKLKRAVLVTSHYADGQVQSQALKLDAKVLPKQLAAEIAIDIYEGEKAVDLIIVDDDEFVRDSLVYLLKENGKTVAQYHDPLAFLSEAKEYSKDAAVLLDHQFNGDMNGIELAKYLHEMGYTRLYLFSGRDFNKSDLPSYLNVISKTDVKSIYKLF